MAAAQTKSAHDRPLDHKNYYRLPWSANDNACAWLEPTKNCNMACEGCYSANDTGVHKTLHQVRQDLDVIGRYRNTHTVMISGGDPLTHPQVEDVVRLVSARGYVPVLLTNGLALTPRLLDGLKRAGLKGFNFHVDSRQKRPGWTGRNEIELNELRRTYAEMVARPGGLTCSFHTTVYGDTLKHVPGILKWAQRHIESVHLMTFIAFRTFREYMPEGRFEYFANGKKVALPAASDDAGGAASRTDITSREIVREIRREYPDFEPCGYLGGTEDHDALKWLFTIRIGKNDGIYGCLGPKLMEIFQIFHHMFTGKYRANIPPGIRAASKWLFPAALIDKPAAMAFRRYLSACLKDPSKLLSPVHTQEVVILQPPDILADGRQSMCDACPDMTVWNGRLVWSCRLEELTRFGCFLTPVPKPEQP
ncbi:MAG: hypothetical protein A2X28_03005 [Elusimicrobia bacterium GWA2_56_46]|nr:MAG: hypothetical protein A2X28_03005 [Elusimicrobia bacterium GWA2_56_46]OGR54244.1 MAG: hypothetical protein A2X39_08950 [Elusimicrobia bacterium GWC2_56_31]